MKTRIAVTCLVVMMLLASSATAFDGKRKGFVLGGGLGVSPVASWKGDLDTSSKFEDSGPGFAAQFIIGYAWDNHNMIVYEGNGVGYSSDAYGVNFTAAQAFNGVSWYHYFGPAGRSMFTVAGLGAYTFQGELDYHGVDFSNDASGAAMGGFGYEFSRHWQVGFYAAVGRTTDSDANIDFDHAHISVLVSGVAF